MRLPKITQVFLVLFIAVLCGFFFVTNKYHYPLLGDDGPCFLPAAIHYAQGDGLIDPVWTPPQVYDEAHPEHFTWHGVLYPMFLGKITPSPTYEGLRSVIVWLRIATLILGTLAFYRAMTLWGLTSPWRDILAIFQALALCSFIPVGERPEILTLLIIILSINLALFTKLKWHWLIFGVAVGLLIPSTPATGIMAVEILGIYACVRHTPVRAVRFLVGAGLVSIAVFSLCFAAYPYSLEAWLTGMILHAKVAVYADSSENNIIALLKGLPLIAWFLFYLMALAYVTGIYLMLKKPEAVGFRMGVIGFSLILLEFIYVHSIKVSFGFYNNQSCVPLIILLISFGVIFSVRCSSKASGAPRPHLRYALLCAIFALASLYFIRGALAFPGTLRDGMSYEEARAELANLRKPGVKIWMERVTFDLTEDYSGVWVASEKAPTDCLLLIFQQKCRSLTPKPIPGYTLIKNFFKTTRPTFLGVRLTNTPLGYSFAVYERNKSTNPMDREENYIPVAEIIHATR